MEQKTAALIGASGLIGYEILTILTQDDFYKEIRVITRRSLQIDHPKVKEIIINFEDEQAYRASLMGANHVYCSIGTTTKKVKGDKTLYRKVDYDIPINGAKLSFDLGVSHFSLVSSIGANDQSSNFYLQLKGEVEKEISQFAIASIGIYRPSMLLGDRKEFRFGEVVSKTLFVPLSFLVPAHYKPIQAKSVAKAMVENAKLETPGIQISYFNEMMKMN
jgi:uncharacterized protein YbjT (DUF2867 family)